MSEISFDALVDETTRRLTCAADDTVAHPITAAADVLYYRGVLAILVGYRAVAEQLEPR